jgi:hypothetical protein
MLIGSQSTDAFLFNAGSLNEFFYVANEMYSAFRPTFKPPNPGTAGAARYAVPAHSVLPPAVVFGIGRDLTIPCTVDEAPCKHSGD